MVVKSGLVTKQVFITKQLIKCLKCHLKDIMNLTKHTPDYVNILSKFIEQVFMFCNLFHHPSVTLSKFKLQRREQYLRNKIP